MAATDFGPDGTPTPFATLVDEMWGDIMEYWLRCGEGGTDPLVDSSGNGRTTNLGSTIERLTPGLLTDAGDDDGAIRLDGTNDFLTVSSYNPWVVGSTVSFVWRCRRPSPSTVNDTMFSTGSSGNTPIARFSAAGIFSFGPLGFGFNSRSWDPAFGIGWDDFDTIASLIFIYDDATGNATFGVDGAFQPTYQVNTSRLPAVGAETLQIGASGNLSEHKAKCDFDEIVICRGAVSEADFLKYHKAATDAADRPEGSVTFDTTPPLEYSDRSYFPREGVNWTAADSIWTRELGEDRRVHENSDAICEFVRSYSAKTGGLAGGEGGPNNFVTEDGYGYTVVISNNSDPLYTISISAEYQGYGNPYHGSTFRCPEGMVASTGSDHHLHVINAETGKQMSLWNVSVINDGTHAITAQNGNVGGDPDLFAGQYQSWSSIGVNIAPLSGLIHPKEFELGEINHALQMIVGATKLDSWSYPANKNPGEIDNANAPYAGQCFSWAETVEEIEAYSGVSPWQKGILKALRTYGAYITDTGGFQIGRFMDYHSFTWMGDDNPYTTFWDARNAAGDGNIYNNAGTKTFLNANDIDWTQLVALDVVQGQKWPR